MYKNSKIEKNSLNHRAAETENPIFDTIERKQMAAPFSYKLQVN
jgi:hypothetical protein